MNEEKTLYLVRHAKSDWNHPDLSDFERPLNPRGLRDAPAMGLRLKKLGVSPAVMVSSPARRAQQTTQLIRQALDFPVDRVVFNENIYEASVQTLLNIIQQLDDSVSSAMLIGHNPAMSELIRKLTGSYAEMPTLGVATLRISSPEWSKTGSCPAVLEDFTYPKKADPV